jgi:hypothetical protein
MVLSLALLSVLISDPIAEAAAPSFAAKEDFNVPMAESVATGDMNGDGKPDLVVTTLQDSHVSVLLNTTAPGAATPSFAARQDFTTPFSALGLALGDVNGDGRLDVAIDCNNPTNSFSVFLNTTAPGSMTMSFAARQDFPTGISPQFMTMADLNMDGKLDLAIATAGTTSVAVFLNTTAPGAAVPSFAAKQDFDTGIGTANVAIGDMNNDGKPDLTSANNTTDTVSVLLNTTTPGSVTFSFAPKQDFVMGNQPSFVVVGDLNGDGRLDVATSHTVSSKASIRLNTTAPGAAVMSFSAVQVFDTGAGPFSIGLRDLNGDGRADLVTANRDANSVSVLVNTTAPGAATPTFSPKADLTVGSQPFTVAFGDFNGDGKPDLTSANRNDGTVSVLLNTTAIDPATPSFTAKQDFAGGFGPVGVAAGDLNGDGTADLALANINSSNVSVLLNTAAPGAASPSFAAKQDFDVAGGPRSIAIGDFNNDGKLDLVITNQGPGPGINSVSVLLNTTAPGAAVPSFAAKQHFTTTTSPQCLTVGDLNNDGLLDLAVTIKPSGAISVLLNTTAPGATTASFAAKQDFATDPATLFNFVVAIGDMNSDGMQDLVVANQTSSLASVLLNTSAPGATTLTFAAKQDFPTGVQPVSLTLSDFNGDGKLDVATANLSPSTASVLLNTTEPGAVTLNFAAKQDFPANSSPNSVTTGDLNGDGKPDLAVANDSGRVSVLSNTTAPGAASPSFAAFQDFAAASNPFCVVVHDLNGDGKADLAVANRVSNNVSVLLNTPKLVAATGVTRPEGAASGNSQIATVTNYGGDGGLTVTVTSANPSGGVTISNIVNTNGNVTADIVAACGATNAIFTLQATDGSSTVNGTLNVTVTANTAPTLTYSTPQSVAFNGSVNVSPTTASDNRSITGYAVQSVVPALTIAPTVNASGVVSITNAQPVGSHVITIRATDDCGVTTDAAFTLNVSKGNQTITVGTHAPANATHNTSFTVAATSSSGLPVSYSSAGVCTHVGATFTMTSGTGTCTVRYDQLGDSNFNAAPQVTESVTAQKANQTITVGTHAPANATYNTSFTVAATSNSSLAIAYSSAGVCTNVGATFTMTSGTGTCTVRYDQTGNSNFNPATQVTESVSAQKANQTITVGTHAPANATFNTSFTVAATSNSGLAVAYSSAGVCTNVSATFTMTSGTGTCTVRYDQAGNSNFNPATQVTESVTAQKANQTITVGTHAPANAIFNTSFTVAATSNSGLAVAYSSSGVCTNVGATFTMASGTGTCTVRYDQAGNSNFNPATQVTESVTAQKANQTITVGTHAPANAAFNTSFAVAATSNSGLAVAYSSSGVCTNVGATFTMASGTGTCSVRYDQAGDSNFNSAPQVTESVTAQRANQTITVGTHAPANATFNSNFTVAATSDSGLTVSYSSAGVCTNVGATFTMTSGTGTCSVRYDQAGDSNFNSAPQVTESVTALKASTLTAVTSSLNPSVVGQNVTFTATVTSTAGTPTGTVQFKIDGVNVGSPVTLNGSGAAQLTTNSLSPGPHTVAADYSGNTNFAVSTGTLSNGQFVSQPLIGLSALLYTVSESSGFVTITVNRSNVTTTAVSVDYSTSEDNGMPCSTGIGVPTPKCDFTAAVGTLNFAPGETTKTITVLITQDSFVEGEETFTLTLSNPTGGAGLVTPSTAFITIRDDATEPPTNPIDDARNFVRQHYHDFLNREPDQSGWDFWTNQITSCGSDVQCDEVRRVDVSASFFLSIEFQQTGYLVERFYKVGYGDATGTSGFVNQHQLPVPTVRVNEFLTDTQRIGRGVVVLAPGWEQLLESNKQAYALEFVQTPRFVTALPTSMTPAQFVDMLNQNAGNVLSPSERTTAINLFGAAGNSSNLTARAQAVRQVAEDIDLYNAEFNRAFVLTEYFGYLRRNPNDAPESTLDYTGYDFWLTKLNQFNGNYINAEMVKAFLSSIEYRQRFGP